MTKRIAVVVFMDNSGNVILQKRGSHSKSGEKYGFWGGGIEEGETPDQAIARELKEELNWCPKELNYKLNLEFGMISGPLKGWGFVIFVYQSPITEKLGRVKIGEGDGIYKTTVKEILASPEFDEVDKEIVRRITKMGYNRINDKYKTSFTTN
jgi:mutator protein MutT